MDDTLEFSCSEVIRVANLVKNTQPIWSGHLLRVAEAVRLPRTQGAAMIDYIKQELRIAIDAIVKIDDDPDNMNVRRNAEIACFYAVQRIAATPPDDEAVRLLKACEQWVIASDAPLYLTDHIRAYLARKEQ